MDAGFGKIGKHVNRQKCQYSIVNDVNTETNLSENWETPTCQQMSTPKHKNMSFVHKLKILTAVTQRYLYLSSLAWED